MRVVITRLATTLSMDFDLGITLMIDACLNFKLTFRTCPLHFLMSSTVNLTMNCTLLYTNFIILYNTYAFIFVARNSKMV